MAEKITKCLKKIKLQDFKLDYNKPEHFSTLWFGPKKFYLVWTTFWAAYHLVWISLDWYWWNQKVPSKGLWIIFLTNQCYTIMTITAFLDFIISHYIHCTREDLLTDPRWNHLPWYMKIFWVLFNISNAGSVLLTLGYWTMLRKSTGPSTLNKHGINCIYTISSLLLTAKPVRFQHAYIPIIFNFCYIIFTLIFNLAGGKPIYSFLNWREKPGFSAMLSILYILILVPLAHFSMYGVYRIRMLLYKRYTQKKDQNQNEKQKEEATKMERIKQKQRESERKSDSDISDKIDSDVMTSEVPMLPHGHV